MIFRRKLLAVFALTVFVSVAVVALLVLAVTRRAFEKSEEQRTAALVSQFQSEFKRRGEDVARRVEAIATSDAVSRMATTLGGASLNGTSNGASSGTLITSIRKSDVFGSLSGASPEHPASSAAGRTNDVPET